MKKEENPEKRFKTIQSIPNGHMKKSSFGGGGSGSKFYSSDLDKELLAAEKFLNKNNDDILKSSNRGDPTAEMGEQIQQKINKDNRIHKVDNKLDPAFVKYQKQLKAFGFPEIGNFYFPSESNEDKEKTFYFFDFIIMKKSTENEEKMKFKKQIDILSCKITSLQSDNERLEKELMSINDEMKKVSKDKKDFENKINKSKESLEKQTNELKSINSKMGNKYHTLLAEKKAIEEKLNKVSENYQKHINKSNTKSANHIDLVDNLKKNDILRLLSKVKGTEKLIDTFKNGFNESLRELLFEVSALKNFIYEVNIDIIKQIDGKFMEIDYNLLNMPFLDTVNKIKLVFKHNLKLLNKFSKGSDRDSTLIFDENKIIGGNSEMYNDFEMTFDKKEVLSGGGVNRSISGININKNLIFDIEDIKDLKENSTNISHSIIDDNYENELEFLKNKWVKTLMKINDKTNNLSESHDQDEN